MNEEDNKTFIRITNKDIWRKLEVIEATQRETLEHAKYTNGRVGKLEDEVYELKKKSIVHWVQKNPIRFTMIVIGLISLLSIEPLDVVSQILKNMV